jgi:hypothetical protein
MACLNIPAEFRLPNNSWVNGQEGLLVFLNLMAYPYRLIDLEKVFGWEMTRLSRIFNWMKLYIYDNHKNLLENNFQWHARFWEKSKQAIQSKKRRLHPHGQLNNRTVNVCSFMDCFRVEICHPTDCVGQPDANGNRVDLDIQALVYNGNIIYHYMMFVFEHMHSISFFFFFMVRNFITTANSNFFFFSFFNFTFLMGFKSPIF